MRLYIDFMNNIKSHFLSLLICMNCICNNELSAMFQSHIICTLINPVGITLPFCIFSAPSSSSPLQLHKTHNSLPQTTIIFLRYTAPETSFCIILFWESSCYLFLPICPPSLSQVFKVAPIYSHWLFQLPDTMEKMRCLSLCVWFRMMMIPFSSTTILVNGKILFFLMVESLMFHSVQMPQFLYLFIFEGRVDWAHVVAVVTRSSVQAWCAEFYSDVVFSDEIILVSVCKVASLVSVIAALVYIFSKSV